MGKANLEVCYTCITPPCSPIPGMPLTPPSFVNKLCTTLVTEMCITTGGPFPVYAGCDGVPTYTHPPYITRSLGKWPSSIALPIKSGPPLPTVDYMLPQIYCRWCSMVVTPCGPSFPHFFAVLLRWRGLSGLPGTIYSCLDRVSIEACCTCWISHTHSALKYRTPLVPHPPRPLPSIRDLSPCLPQYWM